MKSTTISIAALLLLFGGLLLLPLDTHAQWDNRSDEVWDEFDSGNSTTTWILVGAGVGLAAAAVYTLKKRQDEKEGHESNQEESESARRTVPAQPTRVQELMAAQRHLPVQVRAGFHPITRDPALGLSIRF